MLDDLSYLAGLIDGEGHIGIHSNGRKTPTSRLRRRFVIEVGMTSETVIDWLHANFGGSKRRLRKNNPKWKQQWRWRVQGPEAVVLYRRLQPLLKIKNKIDIPAVLLPSPKATLTKP